MSDTNGTNGSSPPPPSIGDQVAKELFELVAELGENRRLQMVTETRIVGLARVLANRRVPFGEEQADEVADVITGQGDLEHQRGSKMYDTAERIRAAGKGG